MRTWLLQLPISDYALRIRLDHVFDRLADQRFERRQVDVFELLDIETRFARLILAQLLHQLIILFKARHDVERQVLLAGGEAGQEGIPLVSTGVFVVIAAKTDHAAAPQLGFRTGGRLHQLGYGATLLAALFIGDVVEEFLDTLIGRFGLEFGHCQLQFRGCEAIERAI